MDGFIPRTHHREVAGLPYVVVTSSHACGIAIEVTVPGMGPEEQRDRAYVTEKEALDVAENIARILMYQGREPAFSQLT